MVTIQYNVVFYAHPGKSLPRLGFLVTVVDKLPPVATLLLNVKGKTGRTPDRLQTLTTRIDVEMYHMHVLGLYEATHRICALHNIPAVCLPRLQPEKLLVLFVRAKCLCVVFQFVLAQHAWAAEIIHLHIFLFEHLYSPMVNHHVDSIKL